MGDKRVPLSPDEKQRLDALLDERIDTTVLPHGTNLAKDHAGAGPLGQEARSMTMSNEGSTIKQKR